MCHFIRVTYHSILNKNKITGQLIFWIFCNFSENDLFGHIYENDQPYPNAILRTNDPLIKVKNIFECPILTLYK
jgi:hypothetical protein